MDCLVLDSRPARMAVTLACEVIRVLVRTYSDKVGEQVAPDGSDGGSLLQ